MIEDPTVLILGAGASMPFGFPSGVMLKNEIYAILRDKRNMALNQLTNPTVVRNFMERLTYFSESIDTFLEHEKNKDNIELGKMAIAATLLPYE